jgi:hypothetical protein
MNNTVRPVFQDVIAYARELLNHDEEQITDDISKARGEQLSELDKFMRHVKSMSESLGDNPTTNQFDGMIIVAAGFLRKGKRLPAELAKFAADVLEGKRTRPTKPGPDPDRDYLRNIKLNFVVEAVVQKFDIPRYAKGNPTNKTAVDAVSEATRYSVSTVTHALHAAPIRPEIVPIVTSRLGAKLDS